MSSRKVLQHVLRSRSLQLVQRSTTLSHRLPITMTHSVMTQQRVVISLTSLLQKNFYNTQIDISKQPFKIVDYNDIKFLTENEGENSYIIDVREPKEVIEGSIPTSKNVPLSQFKDAWSLSEEDFEKQFGFKKPQKETKITVYCLAGVRSTKASEYLSSLGYENLQNYVGSWADYVEHQKGDNKK
ncbi:MAG: Rhodanese-like domain-containing protein [Benjaminiella poitrasii]|nr:MAG: Rhodanese-like domain-containing protein [Benjaminiella poitrasii]